MRFSLFIEQNKEFDYSNIAKNKWHEILSKTQKESGIYFDTENDDSICVRDIKIDQKEWDFTDCKFRCELRIAGGDWQCSVAYFRCQLVKGYANVPDKYESKMFCFIPNKSEGNPHLQQTKNGQLSAPDNENYFKKSEHPKPNEKLCWSSLKTYLKKLVNQEIANVNKHQ